MRLNSVAYLLCFSVLAFSVGCGGNAKPKTSPDKPGKVDVNAYLCVTGCDGGKKIKDINGPLKDHREKMFERYMRFMDSDSRKGEKKILEQCDSVEAIDRFFAQFWGPLRDPDTSTPENEYKDIIDKRIDNIEHEILIDFPDLNGTLFRSNGGLRGDMANVYLLRDLPHEGAKLSSNRLDLMAWVYYDPNLRPLMVFIFYNKGDGYRLLRNHMVMQTEDAFLQVLKEISKIYPTSAEDFQGIYRELVQNDPYRIFQWGLMNFSYDDKIRIDLVLAPPTPEAITAKAIQPRIIGVPVAPPKDAKIFFSKYFAVVPGFFTMNRDSEGKYRSRLTLGFSDVDWEAKGQIVESKFDIVVVFTNEKTREKKEYGFVMNLSIPPEKYERDQGKYFIIELDDIKDNSGKEGKISLAEVLKTLPPGDYEVKLKLLDIRNFSLKSNTWYQYITIR